MSHGIFGFACKLHKFTSKTLMSKCLISTTKTYFGFVGVSGPRQTNGCEWAGLGRWGPWNVLKRNSKLPKTVRPDYRPPDTERKKV